MDIKTILELASVPEHSVYFMQTTSNGKAFVEDDYLCFSSFEKGDWLTIIGYPLKGDYTHESYLQAKNKAIEKTKALRCFTVAPNLPPSLQEYCIEKDDFYTLCTDAKIPQKLINPIKKASAKLCVELGKEFTPEHRRLWTEFMARTPLKPMVRTLFASTEHIMKAMVEELYLLNAWAFEDEHNPQSKKRLVASLLLDFAPKNFCAYILGAHSKSYYVPHAHDLLFAQMIEISQQKNKKYIHLGLGVNEGITRFKEKWGGKKALPFYMASFPENHTQQNSKQNQNNSIKFHVQTLLSTMTDQKQSSDVLDFMTKSKWDTWVNLPKQKPYAMLWEASKNGKTSWIGGSAHFFCYSFEHSLTKLFNMADTVLFEGPLDSESLKLVSANGREINKEYRPLYPYFSAKEIQKLSRMVRGPEGFLPKLLNTENPNKLDVLWYLQNTRPWTALFTLWTSFLERNGWKQSVDLEAWNLAHDMGKIVVAMESLEEQLASLNSVPPERVVKYFQDCDKWPKMIKENVKNYLAGDLMGLMGTSAEFPTRTKTIISMRDERFRQRMRPFMEQGRSVVFVGTAHMINLRNMLAEDGFTLKQIRI